MEKLKDFRSLLAALFLILSLLLYFDAIPTRGEVEIIESLEPSEENVEVNGVLVSTECAKSSKLLYDAAIENGYQFKHKGFFISSKVLFRMLRANTSGFPEGVYVSYGAKKVNDSSYLPEIILSLPEKTDTTLITEVKDSIKVGNEVNVNALISYRTSFCPNRCFKPIQ
jgi:hypothetical protein